MERGVHARCAPVADEIAEERAGHDHRHVYLVPEADEPRLMTMLVDAGAQAGEPHKVGDLMAVLTLPRAPHTQSP